MKSLNYNGFPTMIGTVADVDATNSLATIKDSFGRNRIVRIDIRRGGGRIPIVGETWLLDRTLGDWTFAALWSDVADILHLGDIFDVTVPLPAEPGGPVTGDFLSYSSGDGWSNGPLLEADISDFGTYSTTSHTHAAADLSDVSNWADWTPTYTNMTVGNGTATARYMPIGKTVHCYYGLTLGSTSTIGTNPRISPPVNIAGVVPSLVPLGGAKFSESGGDDILGVVRKSATANFTFDVYNHTTTYGKSTGLTALIPFSWGTADRFVFSATYESV